ncbi:MAG: toll/interleukin-1 receptor domain-containing protein [Rhizobiales bacterium]|nr:toll/interleukin-1 receptor domain-containing protein [Hyphomicrobiales bacterium]
MKQLSRSNQIPPKIGTYLRRIDFEYVRTAAAIKHDIVASCKFFVIEETTYDNWNGGTVGHDVILFVVEDVLRRIPLADQSKIADEIRSDLNECATSIQNEFLSAVRIELVDENDPDFQRSKSASERRQQSPDSLSIWKQGHVRLFISHRDEHKRKAFELAEALEAFGISSFVAHDTIEATKEWRKEILNGLETMEIMLVFLTDSFHESSYTNQEIGFALGKGVPVISLKLEGKDPPGFVNNEQALRGSLTNPASSSHAVLKLIADKLGRQDRIQSALISAFVESPDYTETKNRFDRMASAVERISDSELSSIVAGFQANSQLYNCAHLTSRYERLKRFLDRATGKHFVIEGREISEMQRRKSSLEAVPF